MQYQQWKEFQNQIQLKLITSAMLKKSEPEKEVDLTPGSGACNSFIVLRSREDSQLRHLLSSSFIYIEHDSRLNNLTAHRRRIYWTFFSYTTVLGGFHSVI